METTGMVVWIKEYHLLIVFWCHTDPDTDIGREGKPDAFGSLGSATATLSFYHDLENEVMRAGIFSTGDRVITVVDALVFIT